MPTKAQRKIKVVEVAGSPYEMGRQYGAACPEMRGAVETTARIFGGRGVVQKLAEKFIPLYLPAAQAYAPEIVEEMRGMAAGANLDFNDVFFLNIGYELAVPSLMGCTSFAAAGPATSQGGVIAGQNFDYINLWEGSLVLLKMKPAGGPAILAVAPLGALGLIGLNSAGLTLNLNLLRNKDSLSPQGGVPSHVMLRKALGSETISEAIGLIASAGNRSAKNYLLTDSQGDIADVETTRDDLDVQFAAQGILTHGNHFKTDRFRPADLAPLNFPDSYIRAQRLLELMEARRGALSVDVMKGLLEDHNNRPNSICRHPNPRNPLPIGRLMKTLVSLISQPKEGKVFLAVGNPCENEYFEYGL